MTGDTIYMPTRSLDPALVERLKGLKSGDPIRITHALRVGDKKWTSSTTGTFRGLNYLATGITTDRVAEDDIVVPTLHFTKDNGELTSVALDELTKVELA
jgi:hypothetical protein